MGDSLTLTLDARVLHGKKAKQLRHSGLVPAVVYGPGIDPVSAQASYSDIERTFNKAGKHSPVQLVVNGAKRIAMIKDVDIEPVKGRIRHISFHAVKATDPVVAEVPIRLVGVGESEAERNGLIVLQSLEQFEVRALPMDLPEALEVSILHLKEAGDNITLGEVTLASNVELVEHKSGHADEDEEDAPKITDLVIATVYEPSALQAANEAAGGDADEDTEVEADNGGDSDQTSQAEETKPGGKSQAEPKQSNVDANK